jgi:hypothetical protein
MPQNDRPIWIEQLLTRGSYSCIEPKWVHFRQGLLRETILDAADGNPYLIERALTCLFVVGASSDVAAVKPFVSHNVEFVRKAAQTCLVEIRRRLG